MHERFAVVFGDGLHEAAGVLEVEQDRLLLCGRGGTGDLELELAFSDLAEVRIGRNRGERLHGHRTVVLERVLEPAIYVAPLGLVPLNEIADLLNPLGDRADEGVFAISVPLKPGCRSRARSLLAEGPPIDPASLGISGHEVYLVGDEAIFVFSGRNVRAQVNKAFHHPAVWRAGLAWQHCFAGPPKTLQPTDLDSDAVATYRWTAQSDGGSVP